MALYDQQNNQTPWYGQQPAYAQTRPMTQVPNAQTYAQQPAQQASQISQFAFITNPGVVDMWPVAPGSEMTFINLETMTMYVKRVDEYNHPLKVRIFKLNEVTDEPAKPLEQTPQVNMDELKSYLSSEIDRVVSDRFQSMFTIRDQHNGSINIGGGVVNA